jgi:methyltransferase
LVVVMLIRLLATIVFVPMLLELLLSRRNERELRALGAVEPEGDVYALMLVAYPLAFLLILGSAWAQPPRLDMFATAGFALFVGAKLLKYWAILSLGMRWTFRVLVPPGSAPLMLGPYRILRHPNYVAVMGEIAGAALIAQAPVVGAVVCAGFGALILLRIRIEERALGFRL